MEQPEDIISIQLKWYFFSFHTMVSDIRLSSRRDIAKRINPGMRLNLYKCVIDIIQMIQDEMDRPSPSRLFYPQALLWHSCNLLFELRCRCDSFVGCRWQSSMTIRSTSKNHRCHTSAGQLISCHVNTSNFFVGRSFFILFCSVLIFHLFRLFLSLLWSSLSSCLFQSPFVFLIFRFDLQMIKISHQNVWYGS